MNIAQFFIERRVITLVLTVVMLGAGMSSYQGLSRLEDPEFTIKDALVITSYPGASAAEVEKEVSENGPAQTRCVEIRPRSFNTYCHHER